MKGASLIAINGLGRIGRLVLRRLVLDAPEALCAVNDVAEVRVLAHLIQHDTVHGPAPFSVAWEPGSLILGGRRIPCFQEPHPERIAWPHDRIQVVLECTGRFTQGREAELHLGRGISRVVVSAPLDSADRSVLGPFHPQEILPTDRLISAGSATAHALALLVQVLDQAFGLEQAIATAVHAYTNDQNILDLPHRDLRLARAATMSMIPGLTPAAAEVERALPHLAGRLQATVVRVPSPDVSLLDLSALLKVDTHAEAVNHAFRQAAEGPFCGVLTLAEAELVSPDFVGNPSSAVVDPFLTRVMGGKLAKVHAWFDNEGAYACRLAELGLSLTNTSA